MGSRGRMLGSCNWNLLVEYKCVDILNNVKVLEYINSKRHLNKLPDISHSKNAIYLLKNYDGSFYQLRIYDYAGHPKIDIDYGIHKSYGEEPVLHVHVWKGARWHGDPNTTHLYTKKDDKKYGIYLRGIIKNEWIN